MKGVEAEAVAATWCSLYGTVHCRCAGVLPDGTMIRQRSYSIEVDRTRYDRKERDHSLFLLPWVSCMGVGYVSCRDTVENVITAILERVFFHETANGFEIPHQPLCCDVDDQWRHFLRRLRVFAVPTTPVPLLEYPATVYSGRKLALYTRAAQRVAITGPLPKYAILSTFLKHEKLPTLKKRLVPRVIQPRRPEYNVSVGRYLHHLEPILYHDIARVYGRPVVMKGFNAFQIGRMLASSWFYFRDPIAVGLDASRFDQHVNSKLLLKEHSVYTKLYYPGHPELVELLSLQLANKGFARCWDGTVKYSVSGGRCSGDMNTAMGNCLVMTALIYGLLHHAGLLERDGTTKVHLYNNGDDCVLIGERTDVLRVQQLVPSWFSRVGIVMKVEDAVETLEQVSFCQTRPLYDGARWRVVREVQQSFSKDAYLLDRRQACELLKAQLSAVGLCGMALTQGLPVLQSYYQAMQRGGGGVTAPPDERFRDSGFFRLSHGIVNYGPREIHPLARVSFARAFGIPPDLQVALEAELDQVDFTTMGPVTRDSVPQKRYF